MPNSAKLVGRNILKLRISIGVVECILGSGVEIYGGAVAKLSRGHLVSIVKVITYRLQISEASK